MEVKMTLRNTIKKTLVGLATVGTLVLPQGIDYSVNGSYKVTQVGEGFSKRIVHEYDDKIVVTGWVHPWGTEFVDEGKDGILEEVYYHALPRVPFSTRLEPTSKFFQDRQAEYENLREEYKKK